MPTRILDAAYKYAPKIGGIEALRLAGGGLRGRAPAADSFFAATCYKRLGTGADAHAERSHVADAET
jgi:hypothetical protein